MTAKAFPEVYNLSGFLSVFQGMSLNLRDLLGSLERFRHAIINPLQLGGSALFPLFAFRSAAWDATLPMAVITGGVHGRLLGAMIWELDVSALRDD